MTVHKSDGEGYLAGPMVGYQTDDGNWSYSFAPMVFSDFTQDWSGNSGPMILNTTVELERHDFDFAASRKINNNFKYYIGYKYQDMSMDFRQSFSAGIPSNDTLRLLPRSSWVSRAYCFLGNICELEPRSSMAILPE